MFVNIFRSFELASVKANTIIVNIDTNVNNFFDNCNYELNYFIRDLGPKYIKDAEEFLF